jgi:ketosteroid isomerase-like protein
VGAPLDVVRGYYAALETGDADAIAVCFTDDAVHYYTRLGRHEGGRTIAEHAARAYDHIEGRWIFENGIAEVRAYHHSNAKNRSGDLLGFDHAGRGHTTLR